MRIAVDLLGGDEAPAVVVDGALQAGTADPDLRLVLVGPAPAAEAVLAGMPAAGRAQVSVLPVTRGVGMADPATDGTDPQTTIGAAVRAVASGQADAVVSAGASGATVAASVLVIGRMPGVHRPALAAILPLARRPVVLLDVGASMRASLADLVQHALLGLGYATALRPVGDDSPVRLGLLSVGTEPGKGDRLRQHADTALRQLDLSGDVRYVGPVEGGDVVSAARADVVVCDGFTGNVLLKGIEAALVAAGQPPIEAPRAAALLGVVSPVVVCHGVATGPDIASGIGLAARLVRADAWAELTKLMEVAR